jgi:hypothetical protein
MLALLIRTSTLRDEQPAVLALRLRFATIRTMDQGKED